MSETSNVVNLPATVDRRRWNPFGGPRVARHKRTPETWAQMADDLAAAKASEAQMKRERDQARSERDAAQQQVEAIKRDVYGLRHQMGQLEGEVRQMRALMAPDPDNPVNQTTHSFVMPERPVDDSDPAEVVTQPISQAELFAEGDPMKPLRPVIRVHEFPTASMPKPTDTFVTGFVHTPPADDSTDAATLLLSRLSMQNSERVQDVTEAQVMALWDTTPASLAHQGKRRSA